MAKRGLETDLFVPTAEMLERAEQLEPPSQGFKLPKKYGSHSQISMYLRCPRQYYLRYVCDHKRPPGVAMCLGSGTHSAVEKTHHHLVDHKVPAPTEELLDCFSDSFEKASEDLESAAWEKEGTTEGAMKDIGTRLVRIYNEKYAASVRPQVLIVDGQEVRGIEKKFEVDVAGVPMLGFIDLIDTNDASSTTSDAERALLLKNGTDVPEAMRTVIADFKTRAKTASQADVDGDLQLTLYSFAMKIPAVRFDLLLKQKVPKFKRVSALRQEVDHLWMKEVVHGVASAITAGVFPPCDPTAWACSEKWCGFWHMCRGKKH
jgi:hypothetical protein